MKQLYEPVPIRKRIQGMRLPITFLIIPILLIVLVILVILVIKLFLLLIL